MAGSHLVEQLEETILGVEAIVEPRLADADRAGMHLDAGAEDVALAPVLDFGEIEYEAMLLLEASP